MITFTLDQAQALLPEARERVAALAVLLAEHQRYADGADNAATAAKEAAADSEAAVRAGLGWFGRQGIQVKSIDPPLLDFPALAVRDGEQTQVLLCWRGDEDTIAFYHPPTTGYRSREPVGMLDHV